MKLGFSTLGCPDWNWSEILNTAKDMGIDGIEIRGVEEEIDPLKIKIFDQQHLDTTLSQLKNAGIEIPLIASSVTLGTPDGDAQAKHAEKLIDFAAANHIPFVRVLPSLEPNPTPIDFDHAQALYRSLCAYAKGTGVRVLIETCGVLAQSEAMLRFLEQADSDACGVLWDIHHPYRYFQEKPQDTCRLLGDFIQYVHVKDSALENDSLQYRMMGLGDVPIFDAVKALHQSGYSGYLTLEWVKRWRPDLRDPDVIFYHFQTYMETLLSEIENNTSM